MKIISLKNGLVCLFLVFFVWIVVLFSSNIALMSACLLVSKTHGDMYAIAKVLENYRVENGTYPFAFPITGTMPKSFHTYCAAISESCCLMHGGKRRNALLYSGINDTGARWICTTGLRRISGHGSLCLTFTITMTMAGYSFLRFWSPSGTISIHRKLTTATSRNRVWRFWLLEHTIHRTALSATETSIVSNNKNRYL